MQRDGHISGSLLPDLLLPTFLKPSNMFMPRVVKQQALRTMSAHHATLPLHLKWTAPQLCNQVSSPLQQTSLGTKGKSLPSLGHLQANRPVIMWHRRRSLPVTPILLRGVKLLIGVKPTSKRLAYWSF